MGQQEQIMTAVKSILDSLPNGKTPEVQKALIGLIQKHGPDKIIPSLIQAINSGKNDPNKLGEIEQAIMQTSSQEEQTQAQMAKLGAKINYLKKINGECPEGYKSEKFKVGGTIKTKCKPCEDKAKKMEDGSKVDKPKSKAIEEFKNSKNTITDQSLVNNAKEEYAQADKKRKEDKEKLAIALKNSTVTSKQFGGELISKKGAFGNASRMSVGEKKK